MSKRTQTSQNTRMMQFWRDIDPAPFSILALRCAQFAQQWEMEDSDTGDGEGLQELSSAQDALASLAQYHPSRWRHFDVNAAKAHSSRVRWVDKKIRPGLFVRDSFGSDVQTFLREQKADILSIWDDIVARHLRAEKEEEEEAWEAQ